MSKQLKAQAKVPNILVSASQALQPSVLTWRSLSKEKGTEPKLCKAPYRPFWQMGDCPIFPGWRASGGIRSRRRIPTSSPVQLPLQNRLKWVDLYVGRTVRYWPRNVIGFLFPHSAWKRGVSALSSPIRMQKYPIVYHICLRWQEDFA
jgi:hypothetical protein